MKHSLWSYLILGSIAAALLWASFGAAQLSPSTHTVTYEYSVLRFTETTRHGKLESDRQLLWMLPGPGDNQIRRAESLGQAHASLALPSDFFEAVGGTPDEDGTLAVLLTTIGRQGWRIIDRTQTSSDVTMDEPDGVRRNATVRATEWTFERSR